MSEVLAQLKKKEKGGGGNWKETVLYEGKKTTSSISIAPYNVSDFDAFKIRTRANVAADSWWDVWVFGTTTQIAHIAYGEGNYYACGFRLTDNGTTLGVGNFVYNNSNWVLGIMSVIGIKF